MALTDIERAPILDWMYDNFDSPKSDVIANAANLFHITKFEAGRLYKELKAKETVTDLTPAPVIADDEPAPDDGEPLPEISDKQKLFVDAYLGKAMCNATEAARLAGYADPNSQSSRLLVNVGIAAHIEHGLKSVLMGPSETLKRLGAQARADYYDWLDAEGNIDINLGREKGLGHLIESYTTRESERGSSVTLKLYSAQQALTTIAKHHGLLTDKVEHSGSVKVETQLPHDQALEHAAEHLRRAGYTVLPPDVSTKQAQIAGS